MFAWQRSAEQRSAGARAIERGRAGVKDKVADCRLNEPRRCARAAAVAAHHILSFARDPMRGGVERVLLRLAGDWGRTRRITLLLGSAGGDLPAGVETIVLGGRDMAGLWRALPGLVARTRPDLLFCPGNRYTSLALWTKLRLGRAAPPIVGKQSTAVRRRDGGPLVDLGHRAWLRGHGRFLDHLVAMTPATAAAAERATGMTGRVSVIPNPPPRPGAGGPPPPLPDRFVLGVGRLAPQKRWDRLIAALPHLSPAHLVLVGEGPERAALARQARELGVAARLHMLGAVRDPGPLMARAAVLALTSDYEGTPGVLGEALAVGTPVVATDSSPAIAEIVTAPALGGIVPRDDPAALVAALRHRLAPATPRPAPRPAAGADSAARYLQLFDRIVDAR